MSTLQTQLVKKTAIIDSGDFNLSAARYLEKVEINSSFDLIKMSDLDIEYFKGINVKNKNPENGKFRLIPSGANFPDKLIKNKCKYFDDISDKALEKKLILNDILFNTGGQGTLGRVGIYNDDSFESFTDGFILTIRNKDNKLNSKYLFWVLQSNEIKNEIIKFTRGATGITSIKTDDILNFEFPLPPLEIQEQIVKEIEGYQQIIDGCRQVVENYKPEIDIDPSWEKFELKKFISVKNGHAFKSKLFQKNGIQIIRMSNIKMNLFEPHIKPVFYDKKNKDKFLKYIIKKGDILISMTGTQGKRDYGYVCIVNNDSEYLLNQRIGKIELFNDKLIKMFLYIIMSQKFFQDQVFKKSTGVRQANISSKSLEEIQIPLPSKKDQEIIVEKLEQEREVIEGNKELIKIYEKKINDKIKELF